MLFSTNDSIFAFIVENSPSLRTTVIVASWHAPGLIDLETITWLYRYQDLSNVLAQNPFQLNLVPLFNSLKHGGLENDACLDEYHVLGQAVRTRPDSPPHHMQIYDCIIWKSQRELVKQQ